MTAESRKAIPGRAHGEDRNLDRLVFGDRETPAVETPPGPPHKKDIKVRFREYPANDDGEETAEDPVKVGEISFVERAAKDRRRKEDRRRGYSRLPDERGNFGSENSKRGPMLAAIAIAVVLVFGALVWNMYRDGVKSEMKSVKPKAIAGGSYKSKPEVDAGVDVDGAQVFDQVGAATAGSLDGGPKAADVEASLAPSPEPSAAARVAPPVAPSPAKADVKPSPTPPVAAPKVDAKPAAAPSPVAKAAPPPAPKPEARAVAPKVAAPVVVASAAPAAGPAGFKPSFAAGGPYVVQLAALSSEAEAEAEWAKRARSAPDLFGSAEKIVVKAEVNGKTVYRLRAGAFANAADAESFCAAFKAKGGVCFRAAR